METIRENSTNIILSGANWKPSRNPEPDKDATLTTPVLHCAGGSSQRSYVRKRHKGVQIRKEDLKPSLATDAVVLYIENPKAPRTNKLNRVVGCKTNRQKSVVFLSTNNAQSEKEIKKAIPFTEASYLNVFLSQ